MKQKPIAKAKSPVLTKHQLSMIQCNQKEEVAFIRRSVANNSQLRESPKPSTLKVLTQSHQLHGPRRNRSENKTHSSLAKQSLNFTSLFARQNNIKKGTQKSRY